MLRIFIDHGEAYGNLGDEAMLTSALQRITAELGDVHFVVPREGSRPLPAFTGYSVEHVPSPFPSFISQGESAKKTRAFDFIKRTIAKNDMLTTVGLFAEFYARTGRLERVDPDFGKFLKGLATCDAFYGVGAADFNDFNAQGSIYKLWLYRIARRHVPVVVVACQGFGPFNNPRWGKYARHGFNSIDILSFRDYSLSRDVCSALGLDRPEMKVVGDEAFCLPCAQSDEVDSVLDSIGIRPSEDFVAVHWRHTDYTQSTDQFLPKIARACDIAASTGSRLLFIPMSYDEHSGHDHELVTVLKSLMQNADHLFCLPVQRDVKINKAVIGRAIYTLGLSYHVHVFGLSQGIPAVILYTGEYYRYKSEGLVAFYGPPNAALNLATADDAALSATISGVANNPSSLRPSIDKVNKDIMSVNNWTIEMMTKKIRKNRYLC